MEDIMKRLIFKGQLANGEISFIELQEMFESGELSSFLDDRALIFVDYYLHSETKSLAGIKSRTIYKGVKIGEKWSEIRSENKKGKLGILEKMFYQALGFNFKVRHDIIDVLEAYCALNCCYLNVLAKNKTIEIDGIVYDIKEEIQRLKDRKGRGEEIQEQERLDKLRMPWETGFTKRIVPLKLYAMYGGNVSAIPSQLVWEYEDELGNKVRYNLGTLVVNLRTEYWRNILSDEQVKELDQLGMNWSVSKYTRKSVGTKPTRSKKSEVRSEL